MRSFSRVSRMCPRMCDMMLLHKFKEYCEESRTLGKEHGHDVFKMFEVLLYFLPAYFAQLSLFYEHNTDGLKFIILLIVFYVFRYGILRIGYLLFSIISWIMSFINVFGDYHSPRLIIGILIVFCLTWCILMVPYEICDFIEENHWRS